MIWVMNSHAVLSVSYFSAGFVRHRVSLRLRCSEQTKAFPQGSSRLGCHKNTFLFIVTILILTSVILLGFPGNGPPGLRESSFSSKLGRKCIEERNICHFLKCFIQTVLT